MHRTTRIVLALSCAIAAVAGATAAGAAEEPTTTAPSTSTTTTSSTTTTTTTSSTTTTTSALAPTTSSTTTTAAAPDADDERGPAEREAICSFCNGKIAFASFRTGNGDIYTMSNSGLNPRRLTTSTAVDADPSYSPDGTKIAFTSFRTGNGDIYTMNADGTGQKRITFGTAVDDQPAWSPLGNKIAFTSDRGGSDDIWTMNVDGTGLVRLTDDPAIDGYASWSPTGGRISFYSYRAAPQSEIYTMNYDGSGETRQTNNSSYEFTTAWSPAGGELAIEKQIGNYEICIGPIGPTCTSITNDPSDDGSPSYSPDGTKIAFDSNRATNFDVFSMRTDGNVQADLTQRPGDDRSPDWQKTRPRPDASIKKASPATDVEVGDDRYYATRTGLQPQLKTANVARGHSTTFYVRAQKEAGLSETFKVFGTGSDSKFRVRYYVGATDITNKVVTNTYQLAVPAGFFGKIVRVVVTALSSAPRLSTKSVYVTLTSTATPADKDTVRAAVAAV